MFEAQLNCQADNLATDLYINSLIDHTKVLTMSTVSNQLNINDNTIMRNFKSIIPFSKTYNPLLLFLKIKTTG